MFLADMDLKVLKGRKKLKIRFSDRRTPKVTADGRRLPVPCYIILYLTISYFLVDSQKLSVEAEFHLW